MKQTRQAVHAVKLSIFLDVYVLTTIVATTMKFKLKIKLVAKSNSLFVRRINNVFRAEKA